LSAQEALDQCQPTLADAAGAALAPTPTPVTIAAAPTVSSVSAPPAVAPITAPPTAAPAPLLLDPLLAQIERGNPQAAIAGMPLILRRLLPLLRLLSPTQRDGLIRFLQSDRSNPADNRRAS